MRGRPPNVTPRVAAPTRWSAVTAASSAEKSSRLSAPIASSRACAMVRRMPGLRSAHRFRGTKARQGHLRGDVVEHDLERHVHPDLLVGNADDRADEARALLQLDERDVVGRVLREPGVI